MSLTASSLISDLKPLVNGQVTDDKAIVAAASKDFGRLIEKIPQAVVHPESTEDVAAVVKYANRNGLNVSTQGSLHAQSGQALSDGGIVISLKQNMNKVLDLDTEAQTARVQAGIVWKDYVEHVAARGMMPPVLTNNLNVTVGGTLSMGGLGVASYREGTQGDTSVALEVVTGEGEIVRCDRETNSELYWHVLATLGQFGIITEATMRVRPYKPLVRTYHLLYDDIRAIMKDYEVLMTDGRFDYMESWCTPCLQGMRKVDGRKQGFAEWFFPLHLTQEHNEGEKPNKEELLAGLSPYKEIHIEDQSTLEYMMRMEPVFEAWKMLDTWDHAHPWVESVMPWDVTADFIDNVLENFPPGALIGGHILLWASKGDSSQVPLFMRPEDEFVMGFGILPALNKNMVDFALPKLDMASDLSMMMGGKRYLSGWVNFKPEQWKQHFGDKYPVLKEMKKKYDPNHTLNPGFVVYDAE